MGFRIPSITCCESCAVRAERGSPAPRSPRRFDLPDAGGPGPCGAPRPAGPRSPRADAGAFDPCGTCGTEPAAGEGPYAAVSGPRLPVALGFFRKVVVEKDISPQMKRALFMRIAAHIARDLLGAVFFVFGIDGFLGLIPLPPLPTPATEFIGAMINTAYLFYVVK